VRGWKGNHEGIVGRGRRDVQRGEERPGGGDGGEGVDRGDSCHPILMGATVVGLGGWGVGAAGGIVEEPESREESGGHLGGSGDRWNKSGWVWGTGGEDGNIQHKCLGGVVLGGGRLLLEGATRVGSEWGRGGGLLKV